MADTSLPVQVDYTSRDYVSLRDDLVARVTTAIPQWDPTDPADFGTVLVEAFAYMGDMLSYYIDRAANESTLSTATRRISVTALARDLGYEPAGYSPSTVTVTFSNTSESAIIVPAKTVVSAAVHTGDSLLSIPFETDISVTVPSGGTATVACSQGLTMTMAGYGTSLGVSTGDVNQLFVIPDRNIIKSSVQVYVYDGVNYYPWQQVQHLSDYSPVARVYNVIDDGFQTFYVGFGDGVSGLVPSSGQTIYAVYTVVDGINGNVPAGSITEITSVPGLTSSDVAVLIGSLTVFNNSAAMGGTDPEDLASIRRNASQAYRASNRAVTLDDYQNIALRVSNCGKASANSTVPGTVVIAVAPSRTVGAAEQRPGYSYSGSTWSTTAEFATLKSDVLTAISASALAGSTTTVVAPTYSNLIVGISAVALPSVRQADAATIIKQAVLEKLEYSSVGFGATIYQNDLLSLVSSLGVASSVSLTNLSRTANSPSINDLTGAYNEIFVLAEADIAVQVTGGASA